MGATAAMVFFFNDAATTEIYTLSLHDALPISPPPPTLGLAFLGKLRDKVGQGNGAFSADGALDGSFRVTVGAGGGARAVTRLEPRRAGGGGGWGTDPPTADWGLGGAGERRGGEERRCPGAPYH